MRLGVVQPDPQRPRRGANLSASGLEFRVHGRVSRKPDARRLRCSDTLRAQSSREGGGGVRGRTALKPGP